MAQINPYLNFNGDCEAAFKFCRSIFGGDFQQLSRYKEMPGSESRPAMETDGELIMHVSLPVSRETILMGSDVAGEWAQHMVTGNNIQLSINADSQEEAERLFKLLGEGGHVKMPMEKTFWDAYFGMLTDKFGISWMVNYDLNQQG